jgi:hypothetical protein
VAILFSYAFADDRGNGGGIVVNYNEVNKRISDAAGAITGTRSARLRIWDTDLGQTKETAFYNEVFPPGSYSMAIPGNVRAVELTDPAGDTYWGMPANYKWVFTLE